MPKEPPPEFEFIADPPSISAFDLDVVKLTAQFVARNGRQFLTQLMQKEQRNYQFDFLRPQHSLFNYFTKLVEQYTKVPGQGAGRGAGPRKHAVHSLSTRTVFLCGAPGCSITLFPCEILVYIWVSLLNATLTAVSKEN